MLANKRIALSLPLLALLEVGTLRRWPSDILAGFWFLLIIALVGMELRAAHASGTPVTST
jgi:hypothetical protein